MTKNKFIVDYSAKKLILHFEGAVHEFNLNDGDVGDFWHSFMKGDGEEMDINFYQESCEEKPALSVYKLKEDVGGTLMIDTSQGTQIEEFEVIGDCKDYLGDPVEKDQLVTKEIMLRATIKVKKGFDLNDLFLCKEGEMGFFMKKDEDFEVTEYHEITEV